MQQDMLDDVLSVDKFQQLQVHGEPPPPASVEAAPVCGVATWMGTGIDDPVLLHAESGMWFSGVSRGLRSRLASAKSKASRVRDGVGELTSGAGAAWADARPLVQRAAWDKGQLEGTPGMEPSAAFLSVVAVSPLPIPVLTSDLPATHTATDYGTVPVCGGSDDRPTVMPAHVFPQLVPTQRAPCALQDKPALPCAGCPPLLIWRCKHPHGLFSMFSLALGHAEACEMNGSALIVDWSDPELLYRPPPGETNLWTAFFKQPAEFAVHPDALIHALQQGNYTETSRHDAVFGAYRGVIEGYGGIPQELASHGRTLCRRSIALCARFQRQLRDSADQLLGGGHRWLAVHIRRGDKAVEAKANFDLTDDELELRIAWQCHAWGCDAVFLCSDDASLKARLSARLTMGVADGGAALIVQMYPSTLPAASGQAAHFDRSLDDFRKAEDVVLEAFLMARACSGLLSTYSNVSATVVYLSPEDYPYTTFWDPIIGLAAAPGLDISVTI